VINTTTRTADTGLMKPSTRRALVYAVGGFLAFGLLLTLLNGDTRGARDIAVAIVGLLLFGGLVAGAWWIRTQPRRSAAEEAARELGLRFSANDVFGLIDRPFPLFRRLASVRGLENVMLGTWHGHEVTLCEYWYARSSNPSLNDFERFSCVMTPLPAWWPELLIAPETLMARALERLTMNEVHLESEAFNRAYTVRSADPRFANALLDATMMQWLLDGSDLSAYEVAGGMLLCYRSPRLQPWELEPLLETTLKFLEQIPDVVSSLFPAPAAGTPSGRASPLR
jgi:hypothetical protein